MDGHGHGNSEVRRQKSEEWFSAHSFFWRLSPVFWILSSLYLAVLSGVIFLYVPVVLGAESECVGCHEARDGTLVTAWRASGHAGLAGGCTVCHGEKHEGAAMRARRDETCTGCHEGAVAHSYATSKHGVIMQLEREDMDWTRPLANANYRVPGCAPCHLHEGGHDTRAGLAGNEETADHWLAVCLSCHSPRYVRRFLETGERMVEIGRMKWREAEALVRAAEERFPSAALVPVRKRLDAMRAHLRNVRLGVGHQSPDYQWWHGHPALDGDLLRIKGLIGRLRREAMIEK